MSALCDALDALPGAQWAALLIAICALIALALFMGRNHSRR